MNTVSEIRHQEENRMIPSLQILYIPHATGYITSSHLCNLLLWLPIQTWPSCELM